MVIARYYWQGLDQSVTSQLAANNNIETWEDTQ